MKKLLCSLIALTLCFSASGCGIMDVLELYKDFFAALNSHPTVVYNGMIYEFDSDNEILYWHEYYKSGELESETIKEVHYIPREVNGFPVKCLGDRYESEPEETSLYKENAMVKHLYCPGIITRTIKGYLQPHESYQEDEILTVYYCGKIVDLRRLGYGKNLVYYVPAEQLDEYQTLWQTQTEDFTADTYEGEVRAANVEYHLNAGDMEDFYYVDYVTPGNRIQNVPPIPLREAWEFVGWYPENSETVWSETAQVPEDGLKLYAKWREI